MKTFFIITFLIIISIISRGVYAAPESTESGDSSKMQQIEDLKDRLATKVAELSQSQRSAISGTIKSVTLTSFTVETQTKDMKIELTDDIKVFQIIKGKRTQLKPENIEKDDSVVVFGTYESTLDLINAKVVFINGVHETRFSGIITDIDRTNYTITVQGPSDTSMLVDIEKTTKAFDWIDGSGITKGGFSKMINGSIVTVTGTPVKTEKDRISASRIIQVVSEQTDTLQSASASAAISPTGSATENPTQTP